MAEVSPFRGLRYNLDKIDHKLAEVVMPPYDVVSPDEQEAFYKISPYNMVRLELGLKMPGDTESDNPHTRAARTLNDWQRDGVLIRDEQPALYYYELDYELPAGVTQTRYGFIGLLRLEDFSSGLVRPHEKTFQSVKAERLGLMSACRANLSPVFALYSDPTLAVDERLRSARETEPVVHFRDHVGMLHRMWRVTAPQALREIAELMRAKPIFIADGHHRYETALKYRDLQRQQLSGKGGGELPSDHIMMYLSNLDQGGLTILPTHRMLRNLDQWHADSFLERASRYFEITSFPATEEGRGQWQAAIQGGRTAQKTVVGLYWSGSESFRVLEAKQESVEAFLRGLGINEVLCGLDVVVLDQLLLKSLLNLSQDFLANENNIHFRHDFRAALEEVKSGVFEVGFFINPTRIEQVQAVANAGLIMPHKATYFYPKVWSGLVIYPFSPLSENAACVG